MHPSFSRRNTYIFFESTLEWRCNGCDGVSNHQPHDCLLNGLFRHRSKKTSKLHFTGFCEGNSPGTGEFPAQMASNGEMFHLMTSSWSTRNDKMQEVYTMKYMQGWSSNPFHWCLSHHISNSMKTWCRHQMETFSALLALCAGNSPVTGEFPAQMPVTRSFEVFFDLRLNKRLSKQSWGWWFERHRTHYDVIVMINLIVILFLGMMLLQIFAHVRKLYRSVDKNLDVRKMNFPSYLKSKIC